MDSNHVRTAAERLRMWRPGAALLWRYERSQFRHDALAALVVALVTIPSAFAYADLAKCAPAAGLYAVVAGMAVFALFTSSRHLLVGPDAAIALLVGAAIGPPAAGDAGKVVTLAMVLAFLTAGVLLLMARLRLGIAADLLSCPAMLGFMNGAAFVIVPCAGMIKLPEFRALWRTRLMEFSWAVASVAGVVLLGTLRGILVAVLLSLLALVFHGSHRPVFVLGRKPRTEIFRPRSKEHPEGEFFPGLLLLKTEGMTHFANARRVGDLIWTLIYEHRPKVIVLDCSAIPDLEYTALKMLTEAEGRLQQSGVSLWLAGLNPEPLQLIQNSALGMTLGRKGICFNLDQALKSFQARSTAAKLRGAS